MSTKGNTYKENLISIGLELTALKKDVAEASNIIKTGLKNAEEDAKKHSLEQEQKRQAREIELRWTAAYAAMSFAAIKASRAMAASFADTVKVFAGFEQSLANTFSVVKDANTSTEDLDRLEAAARRVGATTRSTASEAANALYYLASAGFDAAESVAALDGVNALAIATNSDLASTSEVVATTIRQYGLETAASTDIANTFTAAITNSLATMDKLAKSFQYIGPIAAGLGLSVEETTGALQVLYNKGFTGEKAGRGLRSILTDLADSTSVVNTKLSKLGVTFTSINPAANSLANIIDTLREHGVDATNAVSIFGKVSGVQLQALVSEASDAEGGILDMIEAVTDTNRAFEAMDIQMDTLQGSFDKFKNSQEALKIGFGETIQGPMRAVVDLGTGIVEGLSRMSGGAQVLFVGIAALVSVTTALSLSIKTVSKAIFGVKIALGPLSAGIAIATTAVSGLIAVTASLNKAKLDKIKEEYDELRESMDIPVSSKDSFARSVSGILDSTKALTRTIRSGQVGYISDLGTEIELLSDRYDLTKLQTALIVQQGSKLTEQNREELDHYINLAKRAEELQDEWIDKNKAIEDSIALQKLLDKIGKETADEQAKAQDALVLAYNEAVAEKEILIKKNKEEAESFSILSAVSAEFNTQMHKLISDGLTVENEAAQNLIGTFLRLKDVIEEEGEEQDKYAEKIQDYKDKLEDLGKTELELAELTRNRILVTVEGSNEAKDSVNAYYDAVVDGIIRAKRAESFSDTAEKWKEYDEQLSTYQQKLEAVGETEEESIERQRALALEGVLAETKLEKVINKLFDLLKERAKDKETKDAMIETIELISSVFQSALTVIGTAVSSFYEEEISEVRRLYDEATVIREGMLEDELDRLDEELQSKLEAAGIAEETELERLERERKAAELAGDKKTAQEKQDEIDRLKLTEEYEEKKKQAKLDADDETKRAKTENDKELAKLQYKQAMWEYNLNLTGALAKAAAAVIVGYLRAGTAGAIEAGILGTANVAVAAAQIPPAPKFNNGGIVPGSSFKGDNVPAWLDSGELILNKAQQSNVAEKLSKDTRDIVIHNYMIVDGKQMAENTARYKRNGKVKF